MAYRRFSSYTSSRGRPRARARTRTVFRAPARRRVAARRKAAPRRRAPASRSVPESQISTHDRKFIHAQIDPFDDEATGVKIPDANAMPSLTQKAEDYFSLPLAALETCTCWAVNVIAGNMLVQATGSAGTTWVWPAAFAATAASNKTNAIFNESAAYRTVAQGARLTCGLAPTTLTGFVHLALYINSTYAQATWDLPTSVAQMANLPGYKRIPLSRLTSEGISIINKSLDCTAQRYMDSNTTNQIPVAATYNEFHVPHQWATILVAVDGVPVASTPLAFEVATHWETIPRPTSVNIARQAAAYSPQALGAASSVGAKADPVFLDSTKGQRIQQGFEAAGKGIAKVAGVAGKGTSFGRNLFGAVRNAAAGARAGRVLGPAGAVVGAIGGLVSSVKQPQTSTSYDIGSSFNKGSSHDFDMSNRRSGGMWV